MKALQEYQRKRNFKKTSEPKGKFGKKPVASKALKFVVQEHHASHLHYDFRLEMDGVLRSWAVPKGPSPDPDIKRLALEVEDHPLEYGKFQGIIPEHEYGGGEVFIWDKGTWEPHAHSSPRAMFQKGHLDFSLKGKRLKGRWTLIRTHRTGSNGRSHWLLFKKSDRYSVDQDPTIEKKFSPIRKYGSWKNRPKNYRPLKKVWHSNVKNVH